MKMQDKTTQPGLELNGVAKRYGDVVVVEEMSLQAKAGEFIVLLGESGCGKSTTLRMIAGLESVSRGSIRIAGREVTHTPPMQRDIAMVFQNYALYPHMDVAQNMSFALRLAGTGKAAIDKRVQEAAKTLGITHLLERKPKALSGGQRQRVAIGRAIVREPQVFLFDEPLSNLDAKLRGHMRAELALLHERLGKTTVYVTHDQVEAMTLASRIVIMDKGRIQQVGTPEEVFQRPANLFVAGFIGMPGMNLFAGQPRANGSGVRMQRTGIDLPCPLALQDHGAITVGVRPQALSLLQSTAPRNPALGTVRMQVRVVEYLGAESVLVGELIGEADQPQPDGADSRVTAVLPGRRHDLLHRQVTLACAPEALHWFDSDSGQRLAA